MKDIEKFIKTYEKQKENLEQVKELLNKIQELNSELKDIQKECDHEYVFKIWDHFPRKVGIIPECYCPACGKIENTFINNKLKVSSFTNSQIIDLSEKPMMSDEYTLSILKEEFFKSINDSEELDIDDLKQSIFSKMNKNNIKRTLKK